MIYLFDENDQGQMAIQYQIDYIAELPSIGEFVTHVSKRDEIQDIEGMLQKASLICIHDSFPPPDFKAEIVARALQKNTPLVVFSGGASFTISKFDETKTPVNYNYLKQIKKDTFYYNFFDFAKDYAESGEINLQKLVFGKEYEKVRVEIIKDRLGKKIFEMRGNFDYYLFADADEQSVNHQNRRDLWELFDFVYNDDTEIEFSRFEEDVENNGISPKELYSKIQELFEYIQTKA